MKRYFAIFVALFGVMTIVSTAQMADIKAHLGLSRDTILIGDTLTLYIDIEKDIAHDISIPSFKGGKLTETIEIIEGPTLDTLSDKDRVTKLRVKYLITSFDAGNYVLDSFVILSGKAEPFDTVFTLGSALLSVTTFEIDTTKDVAFDIRTILDAPYSWAEFELFVADNWLIILVAIIILAAIAFVVWRYLKRRAAKRNLRRALPPHIRAINSLENVRNKKLWQGGHIKEYFSAITDIIRTYMEERYGIAAMEMTSKEILTALRSMHTEEKLLSAMSELFKVSDLAKFAKALPDSEECETAYFDAYYYVEQTKEIVVEEPGAEELAELETAPPKSEVGSEVGSEIENETQIETKVDKDAKYRGE